MLQFPSEIRVAMRTTEFLFAGYQIRKVVSDPLCGTLADNRNPLYLPGAGNLREDFSHILARCKIPFFITDKDSLVSLIKLVSNDVSCRPEQIRVFWMGLLKSDLVRAFCEFYESDGQLVRRDFASVTALTDLGYPCQHLGLDVLSVSTGGGCDSAIHTYQLQKEGLNPFGLLGCLSQALELRRQADLEVPEHRPFTIWQVGILPKLSRILSPE